MINKPLTNAQLEAIYPYFASSTCPTWAMIAKVLITKGVCIVAGTEPVWRGGIGNFINTKENDSYIGCLEYTFDVDYFISSKYFKETLPNRINSKKQELKKLEEFVKTLTNEVEELNELLEYEST